MQRGGGGGGGGVGGQNRCRYAISTCLLTSSSLKRNIVQRCISLITVASNSIDNYLEKEQNRKLTSSTILVSSQGKPTLDNTAQICDFFVGNKAITIISFSVNNSRDNNSLDNSTTHLITSSLIDAYMPLYPVVSPIFRPHPNRF